MVLDPNRMCVNHLTMLLHKLVRQARAPQKTHFVHSSILFYFILRMGMDGAGNQTLK